MHRDRPPQRRVIALGALPAPVRPNAGRARDLLVLIDEARSDGVDITFDLLDRLIGSVLPVHRREHQSALVPARLDEHRRGNGDVRPSEVARDPPTSPRRSGAGRERRFSPYPGRLVEDRRERHPAVPATFTLWGRRLRMQLRQRARAHSSSCATSCWTSSWQRPASCTLGTRATIRS